jgi:predicted TIM-barrel fold metal-dependent hydrolase
MQLPWLKDPVLAGEEVRRNAERGFTSESFLETPPRLDLPPITDHDHWAPFFRACEETDTVISLHCGASGFTLQGSPGTGLNTQVSMFPGTAFCAAVDWVWAGIPGRYPDLKIALSEGGIGWVPMAIDRLDYVTEHSAGSAAVEAWPFDLTPSELLRRNFWFCMLDDPSTLDQRHLIGVDHIMFETDYPHADSTWPGSQDLLRKRLGDLPFEEASMIAGGNAARLYRHPLRQPASAISSSRLTFGGGSVLSAVGGVVRPAFLASPTLACTAARSSPSISYIATKVDSSPSTANRRTDRNPSSCRSSLMCCSYQAWNSSTRSSDTGPDSTYMIPRAINCLP